VSDVAGRPPSRAGGIPSPPPSSIPPEHRPPALPVARGRGPICRRRSGSGLPSWRPASAAADPASASDADDHPPPTQAARTAPLTPADHHGRWLPLLRGPVLSGLDLRRQAVPATALRHTPARCASPHRHTHPAGLGSSAASNLALHRPHHASALLFPPILVGAAGESPLLARMTALTTPTPRPAPDSLPRSPHGPALCRAPTSGPPPSREASRPRPMSVRTRPFPKPSGCSCSAPPLASAWSLIRQGCRPRSHHAVFACRLGDTRDQPGIHLRIAALTLISPGRQARPAGRWVRPWSARLRPVHNRLVRAAPLPPHPHAPLAPAPCSSARPTDDRPRPAPRPHPMRRNCPTLDTSRRRSAPLRALPPHPAALAPPALPPTAPPANGLCAGLALGLAGGSALLAKPHKAAKKLSRSPGCLGPPDLRGSGGGPGLPLLAIAGRMPSFAQRKTPVAPSFQRACAGPLSLASAPLAALAQSAPPAPPSTPCPAGHPVPVLGVRSPSRAAAIHPPPPGLSGGRWASSSDHPTPAAAPGTAFRPPAPCPPNIPPAPPAPSLHLSRLSRAHSGPSPRSRRAPPCRQPVSARCCWPRGPPPARSRASPTCARPSAVDLPAPHTPYFGLGRRPPPVCGVGSETADHGWRPWWAPPPDPHQVRCTAMNP